MRAVEFFKRVRYGEKKEKQSLSINGRHGNGTRPPALRDGHRVPFHRDILIALLLRQRPAFQIIINV